MPYTIELAPEVEQALEEKAQRYGVAPDEYLRDLIERAMASDPDEVAMLYADSLANNGALTAFSATQ